MTKYGFRKQKRLTENTNSLNTELLKLLSYGKVQKKEQLNNSKVVKETTHSYKQNSVQWQEELIYAFLQNEYGPKLLHGQQLI